MLRPPQDTDTLPEPRYGIVLLGIILVIIFSAGAGESGFIGMMALLTQGFVLVFTLKTSAVKARLLRIAEILTVVAVAAGITTQIIEGQSGTAAAELVSVLLVIATPIAIIKRLSLEKMIDGPVVAGAICLYLLIGLFYADVYAIYARFDPDPFFVQMDDPTQADFVYFSYVTMTTVGYGDFTAASSLARMIAVTEALIGQLYLVTVVALAVSRMGAFRRSRKDVLDELDGEEPRE